MLYVDIHIKIKKMNCIHNIF